MFSILCPFEVRRFVVCAQVFPAVTGEDSIYLCNTESLQNEILYQPVLNFCQTTTTVQIAAQRYGAYAAYIKKYFYIEYNLF